MAKEISVNYMPPGMLEFGVTEADENRESTGYGPVGLGDLQVDRDAKTGEYLSFVAYNFDRTYFDIIQKLSEREIPYRYNISQDGLEDLTLREVLTWIYAKYVLGGKKLKVAV